MPELPDLQVFSKNLHKLFAGKKLSTINIINNKKIKHSEADVKKNLEGKLLTSVFRTGKELRFEFADGTLLGLHLMLHGNLYLFDKINTSDYTIAEFHFGNKGLALTDWQALATVALQPEEKKGKDALSPELNCEYLKKALQSKAKIKNVLTNQDIIRGIGNAYADEILWEARISPFSISSAVPEFTIEILEKAIKKVLTNAEKEILKKHPDIITGEVRDFLSIHTRSKKESPGNAVIKVDKSGSRITYYTDEQELYV